MCVCVLVCVFFGVFLFVCFVFVCVCFLCVCVCVFFLLVLLMPLTLQRGFPGGTVVKILPANVEDAKDVGLIPWLGRFTGVGNCNSLQYSCLQNPMDRRAWLVTDHGVAKSRT